MGLCFPKECSKQEVSDFTHDLIKGYAEGVGWGNVTIDYHMASQYDANQTSDSSAGLTGFGAILLIAGGLMAVGTFFEMSTCGDKPEFKGDDHGQALYEAGKFRRLA